MSPARMSVRLGERAWMMFGTDVGEWSTEERLLAGGGPCRDDPVSSVIEGSCAPHT